MAKISIQGDATDIAPRNFERPYGGGCLRHGCASYHAFWAVHAILRPATVGLCVDDEQTGLVDDGEGFKHVVRAAKSTVGRAPVESLHRLAGLARTATVAGCSFGKSGGSFSTSFLTNLPPLRFRLFALAFFFPRALPVAHLS